MTPGRGEEEGLFFRSSCLFMYEYENMHRNVTYGDQVFTVLLESLTASVSPAAPEKLQEKTKELTFIFFYFT